MAELHHFYHIYCGINSIRTLRESSAKGWRTPAIDHIRALKVSGLIDNLSSFQIGIVGPEERRAEVKEFLDSQDLSYTICAEVDEGWEQETQDKIYDFAQENDGYVYYAHTKNATVINDVHLKWRLSMTYHNTILWNDIVSKLNDGFSAVGIHYINGATPPTPENIKNIHGFFGGTFWWTHLKYIKNFPHKPLRDNRYQAEVWIWSLKDVVEQAGDEFKIYDFVPTWPGGLEVPAW